MTFVRFQQGSARMSLAEGHLESAVAAARQLRAEDFEDAEAAQRYLRWLDAGTDQAIAAVNGLSQLAPRR